MDIKTGEHSYDNTKIAEYVARWGKADSIALFDPRFIIFSAPPIEGVIGYRVEAQCAIVIADPICAPEDVPALTKAFHDFCAERYKTVIYVMASEPFTQWAVGTVCKRAISIGNEVILDPTIDIKTGNGSSVRRLRNKYNHALRAGVVIKEYVGNDLYTEQSMEQLRNQWLQNREGMQIYHSEINLFAHRMGRRWFCVAYQGTIVGMIILNRIDMREGWVLNRLILLPDVPYGTSELCILSILDILRNEGCHFFSMGTTPSQAIDKTHGFGPFTQWLIHGGFKIAQKFLPLNGRQLFWEKFYPQKETTFLVFDKTFLGPREVCGIMRAFNAGNKDSE